MHTKHLIATFSLLAALGIFGIGQAYSEFVEEIDKPQAEEGFTVLFDGSSTEHFRSFRKETFPESGWVIEDGTLHIKAGSGVGDIITKEAYSDFDLRFEWKVAEAANSGVMYRVSEKHGATYLTGPEYQILDDDKHPNGKNPKESAGSLFALIACNKNKALKPVGEWNTSRINIMNNKVEHYLNGKLVVEYVWGSDEVKELIANSKFNGWGDFMKEDKGHISFQDHNDNVWFRNIRIKDNSEAKSDKK